jgi:peptide/nickel transport system substrate-binding protein
MNSKAAAAASAAPHGFPRREFLRVSALGGGILAASALGAGCGSASSPSIQPSSGLKPRHGGVLRAGFSGGTSTDTLNAEAVVNSVDNARIPQLYEPLIQYDSDAKLSLVLASELLPNANATTWTIRVRPDVTFHNGKPLTAEDVIFSLRYICNPKSPFEGAGELSPVDLNGLRKLDNLTVLVPCNRPFASLPDILADTYTNIVPVGYDPRHPVGTGPFKYGSFTPGVQSVFLRNENYWQAPLPYVDKVIISDYPDETSQINGLASGAVDLINYLSAESIAPVESSGNKILISDGAGFTPFTMRVDVPPFNDVRVRQAFRYVVDRPQMLDHVFAGHGTIGNDIFSIWDPDYDHSIPQRTQDIDYAKYLLRKAGKEDLTVELVTADIAQGTVLAAEVLAQQAKAAGITVNLNQVTSTELYGPNYLKWAFAQDYWYYFSYLCTVSQATLPTSPFNECHFDNPRYNSLYYASNAITNPGDRKPDEYDMQEIDWNEGGYIIPYFPPTIDGYGKNVHGVVPSKTGISFNHADFKNMWFS